MILLNRPRFCLIRRLGCAAFFLFGIALPRNGDGQEAGSVSASSAVWSPYRGDWFEFLNAHLEDDSRAASNALARMRSTARAAGVLRLSDFSRAALYEARKAEKLGHAERAERAYGAALTLDNANYEAAVSKIEFLLRRGERAEAVRLLPKAAKALFVSQESRLAVLSSLGIAVAFALAAALLATILILLARHLPRLGHDLREASRRLFGEAPGTLPLALAALGLPLLLSFGPGWLLLYWAVLLYTYAEAKERAILAGGLIACGMLLPLLSWIARENVIHRSPLLVAASDLAERREDASAEDGLRQAAAVFPEDPDVWFLLGIYAERSRDFERALGAYGRASEADPKDPRPFLQRGNLHFWDGDYASAIRDYELAAERAPNSAHVYYNLSIARGEAYDFQGQDSAIAKARHISERNVKAWASTPRLSRVVPVGYPISRARDRIARWDSDPKSRRLPGHAPASGLSQTLLSPFTLAPWGALLLGVFLAFWRSHRGGFASECQRCGRPFCHRCRRRGDPVLYCTLCVRLHLRKESAGIELQVAQRKEIWRRNLRTTVVRRLLSILFPGADRIFGERPYAAFLTLFFFFLGLGVALLGGRFFDPWQTAWRPAIRATEVAGASVAVLIWLAANVSAWRKPVGA